jgi:hypothetical protein
MVAKDIWEVIGLLDRKALEDLGDDELDALLFVATEALRDLEMEPDVNVVEARLPRGLNSLQGGYFRELENLTAKLSKRRISRRTFDGKLHDAIAGNFRKAYGMARRGKLTDGDEEYIRRAVTAELGFANKFADSVQTGMSDKARLNRTRMYSQTLEGIAWHADLENQPDDVSIAWVLGDAEHCQDCLLLASMGPFLKHNLPTTPRAGGTICLCLTENHCLIRTKCGNVPFERVQIGDEVLTHKGRWRKVVGKHENKSTVSHRYALLIGDGFEPVGLTDNHRLWTVFGWRTAREVASAGLRVLCVQDAKKGRQKRHEKVLLSELCERWIGEGKRGSVSLLWKALQEETCRDQEVEVGQVVLLPNMLPEGSSLYDLTVEEDRSFVVEGMVVHNSRCKCKLVYKTGVLTRREREDAKQYAAHKDQTLSELMDPSPPPPGMRRPSENEAIYIASLRMGINYHRRKIGRGGLKGKALKREIRLRKELNEELTEFVDKEKIHDVPAWSVDDVLDERHLGRQALDDLFLHGLDGSTLSLLDQERLVSILDRFERATGRKWSKAALLRALKGG